MKADDYQVEDREIKGTKVAITTYRIEKRFYCQIRSKDPGAQISRAQGTTLSEARELALKEAERKLK